MWHQLWIPILIPTLIIKSNCDVNKTDTDVFVQYSGHAEAEYANQALRHVVTDAKPEIARITTTVKITTVKETTPITKEYYEEATENVMFVPNNKPVVRRDEEEDDGNSVKIRDIMMMKTVNDAMGKNFHVEKQIDTPNEDIVFISGKNHDFEKTTIASSRRRGDAEELEYNEEYAQKPATKLNCSDLDCNNTIKSICGAKIVEKQLKYRLFLNDCYFRKVNCGLKYEVNRYKEVTIDKCKLFGAHFAERPFIYKHKAYSLNKPVAKDEYPARRSSSSRRSMTMNYNGQFCSHPCPVSCTEDYDPQCAVSGTGQRRVFLNHCKLDHNSCFYSVVWHKRPLAECVGGQKADMRQNRGFIGWMQRVGIVDNKGRLVLE